MNEILRTMDEQMLKWVNELDELYEKERIILVEIAES